MSTNGGRLGAPSRFAVALGLVATSLLVALLAGEGVLRLIGFSYPSFHAPDELAGVRLRAGAEGWYREEGKAFVRINSDGWRDRERMPAKPPNVVRIAVLGDSFMEAVQVDLDATFASQLERALNSCQAYGTRVAEVLNFGVSSYGTAQQLLTLKERVARYTPDVVLLAFLPSNDVRNNSKKLEGWKARPFFELREGKLVLDASFLGDPGFQERKRSAVIEAQLDRLRLYQLWRRVRAGSYRGWDDAPAAAAMAAGQTATLGEVGIAERVYMPPSAPEWQEAWAVTESLLAAINREARHMAARFIVVVLPSPAAVFPDAQLRRRYAETLGVADLFYPDQRVKQVGEAEGFEVLALGEAMQRGADQTKAHLHGFPNTRLGFGHWNARGHALAAQLVARRLCSVR